MQVTATFQNGFTDTYKGTRPVKAAWAIFDGDKAIASGHSLDQEKAQKNAESKIAEMSKVASTIAGSTVQAARCNIKAARSLGYTGKSASAAVKFIREVNAKAAAELSQKLRIEVVAL